jgi:formylglycine-generating enzyme required for sulfatase activity
MRKLKTWLSLLVLLSGVVGMPAHAERYKTPLAPAKPAWPTDAIARHPETGAPLKAKEVVTHPQRLGPKMVVLPKAPALGYLMGSPSTEVDHGSNEKQHRVTIPYVYAMSQTTVTFNDWASCVKGGGCQGNPSPKADFGAGKMPIINVSHGDAREYVAWLNKTLGLQAGSANWAYRYRLPSEIETEYAARAGSNTLFYTGGDITTAQANYNGNYPYKSNAKGPYRQRTTKVASFAPNDWGLYDMAGNVWAWQADCYESDYDKLGDLKGKAYRDADEDSQACARRSLRGGSWGSDALFLRSASRAGDTPSVAYYSMGFRLTRMLPSGS